MIELNKTINWQPPEVWCRKISVTGLKKIKTGHYPEIDSGQLHFQFGLVMMVILLLLEVLMN